MERELVVFELICQLPAFFREVARIAMLPAYQVMHPQTKNYRKQANLTD